MEYVIVILKAFFHSNIKPFYIHVHHGFIELHCSCCGVRRVFLLQHGEKVLLLQDTVCMLCCLDHSYVFSELYI